MNDIIESGGERRGLRWSETGCVCVAGDIAWNTDALQTHGKDMRGQLCNTRDSSAGHLKEVIKRSLTPPPPI